MIQTHNCDNRQWLPFIEDKSIRLILTDPPYNVLNLDWDNWDFREYIQRFDNIVDGYLAIFGPYRLLSELTTYAVATTGFENLFEYVWVKSTFPLTRVNYKHPTYQHELIPVLCNNPDVGFNHVKIAAKAEIKKRNRKIKSEYEGAKMSGMAGSYISDNKGEKYTSTVLYGPSKAQMDESERTKHPTQKPLNIIRHIIQALTNEGDWVLDPFGGSGTVAVACKQLNRNCIIIEQNKEYYDIMMDRLSKTFPDTKIKNSSLDRLL